MARSALRDGLINDIRQEVSVALSDLQQFEYGSESLRSHALGFLLDHSRDMALGAATVADIDLFDSLVTLTRGLFEGTLWALYVVQSEENADRFLHSGRFTLKQIIGAAERGYSIGTFDIEEARKAFSVRGQAFRLVPSEEADQLGVGAWFRLFYAYLSAPAHGHHASWRVNPDEDNEPGIVGVLGLAQGCLAAIHEIYRAWVWDSKQADVRTVQNMVYREP